MVNKDKGYYKRYYVELSQLRALIDDYKNAEKSKNYFSSLQQARRQMIRSSIENFIYYYSKAEKEPKIVCPYCFQNDLRGSPAWNRMGGQDAYGDPAYGLRIFKDGKYKADSAQTGNIKKQVNQDLNAIETFLKELATKEKTKELSDLVDNIGLIKLIS